MESLNKFFDDLSGCLFYFFLFPFMLVSAILCTVVDFLFKIFSGRKLFGSDDWKGVSLVIAFAYLVFLFVLFVNREPGEVLSQPAISSSEVSRYKGADYEYCLRDVSGSTAISQVGFIEKVDGEGIMFVRYKSNGYLYAYYEVPQYIYARLFDADSKGEYVNEHIKPYYDYERLE